MKNAILGLITCLLSTQLYSSEHKQFENDKICIIKASASSQEEVNFYNDIYPQVVIPIKESSITRLDENGHTTKIQVSPGQAMYFNPEDEKLTHKLTESADFIIIQIKDNSPPLKKEKDSHDISIEIKLNCPMSNELKSFVSSIPPKGNYTVSYDEWATSFKKNINELIKLVESEEIHHSWWSAKTDFDN